MWRQSGWWFERERERERERENETTRMQDIIKACGRSRSTSADWASLCSVDLSNFLDLSGTLYVSQNFLFTQSGRLRARIAKAHSWKFPKLNFSLSLFSSLSPSLSLSSPPPPPPPPAPLALCLSLLNFVPLLLPLASYIYLSPFQLPPSRCAAPTFPSLTTSFQRICLFETHARRINMRKITKVNKKEINDKYKLYIRLRARGTRGCGERRCSFRGAWRIDMKQTTTSSSCPFSLLLSSFTLCTPVSFNRFILVLTATRRLVDRKYWFCNSPLSCILA